MPVGQIDGREFLTAWQGEMASNREFNYWSMGLNHFTNLINQIVGYKINARFFLMNERINDRRMDAMENISSDNRATAEKWIDFQGEADRRLNSRGGLKERVAEIESNRDRGMYRDRLASQERVAALRNLDSAFSLRSDYPYGNPYLPS